MASVSVSLQHERRRHCRFGRRAVIAGGLALVAVVVAAGGLESGDGIAAQPSSSLFASAQLASGADDHHHHDDHDHGSCGGHHHHHDHNDDDGHDHHHEEHDHHDHGSCSHSHSHSHGAEAHSHGHHHHHHHHHYDGHGEGKDPSACPFAHLHGGGASASGVVADGMMGGHRGATARSIYSIALEAACASLATSLLPIIVILICPLHWRALRLFVAFAAGALIADVFTHQLPNFIGPPHDHSGGGEGHDHPHGHSCGGGHHHHHDHHDHGAHGGIGLASLVRLVNSPMFRCAAAMMFTYLIDAIVYSRLAAKAQQQGEVDGLGDGDSACGSPKTPHGHSHGGGAGHSPFSPPPSPKPSPKGDAEKKKDGKKKGSSDKKTDANRGQPTTEGAAVVSHHSASAAIVDLFADALHNFTDGLTLGASFLKGAKVGWHTTLLVLLHEVPHELGDGALLVRGGWTRWEAAKVQVWTGLGNLLGCMVILFINPDQKRIDEWVTPLVAGSFMYVALTGMLGELKEVPPLTFINMLQLLGEVFMFLAGLAFLEIVVHSGMH